MTHRLKIPQFALLLSCAMGAVAAPGAYAAEEHEFHSDGERSILTGGIVGTTIITIGAAGTIECRGGHYEATQTSTEVSGGTFKSDTLTVVPRYSRCEFGGVSAAVNFNHCAYVFDSDTTTGNTDGGEHANLEIECSEGGKIEIDTPICTITTTPQTLKHAVRYENVSPGAITIKTTAKKVVLGKARTTAAQPLSGCLLFPTGEIGNVTSRATLECFKDGGDVLEGTEKTTPAGTEEEGATGCSVTGAPGGVDSIGATVFTGENEGSQDLVISSVGTLKCTTSSLEGTVSEKEADEEPAALTLKPTLSGCTFGGKAATVKTNSCAYVVNQSTGAEGHADLEIECAEGNAIEIDTAECTITIGPQTVTDAVHYETVSASSFAAKVTTAKNGITTGKAKTTESQVDCAKFPTGAIGTYTGTQVVDCFKDTAASPQEDPTTPEGTSEGEGAECPFEVP